MTGVSERPLIVYVDVDDTFVRSIGTKRVPIPSVLEHIRELKEEGAILYCWSSGGAGYARASAEEFGVVDLFKEFLPKPDVILDDQAIDEWRYFACAHPSGCSGRTVQDYKELIKRNPAL